MAIAMAIARLAPMLRVGISCCLPVLCAVHGLASTSSTIKAHGAQQLGGGFAARRHSSFPVGKHLRADGLYPGVQIVLLIVRFAFELSNERPQQSAATAKGAQ